MTEPTQSISDHNAPAGCRLAFPVSSPYSPIGVMLLYDLLAYPNEGKDRDQALRAFHAWYVKACSDTFGKRGLDLEVLGRHNQQIHNQIGRCWKKIQQRVLAADLAFRVLIRLVRANAYPSGLVVNDRLADQESDITKLYIILGASSEATAGSPRRASITSVIHDHVESIMRLRGQRYFENDGGVANLFGRVWKPSKPVLHLAMAFKGDVESPFPGDGWRFKLLSMLLKPDWIGECLERAELIRTVYIPLSPLRIPAEEMIQVLPDRHWLPGER